MSDEHDHIHLPPNSFVPLSLALSLTLLLTSFVFPEWLRMPGLIVGGLWVIATLVQWFRAARTEYFDLPEEAGH
jgi:hypothetical protein